MAVASSGDLCGSKKKFDFNFPSQPKIATQQPQFFTTDTMVKNIETKKRKGMYSSRLFNRVHYSINSDRIVASVAESGAEKVKKAKKVETSPVAAKKRKGKTRNISIAKSWILTGI